MFMENVVRGRIVPNPSGIEGVSGREVIFRDGQRVKCDCLIFCTGYRDVFPFLDAIGDTDMPLSVPENDVRNLFKHVFHPEAPGPSRLESAKEMRGGQEHGLHWLRTAFHGWHSCASEVKAGYSGPEVCAEMAARYFALLLSSEKDLPGAPMVAI